LYIELQVEDAFVRNITTSRRVPEITLRVPHVLIIGFVFQIQDITVFYVSGTYF